VCVCGCGSVGARLGKPVVRSQAAAVPDAVVRNLATAGARGARLDAPLTTATRAHRTVVTGASGRHRSFLPWWGCGRRCLESLLPRTGPRFTPFV